MRFRRPLQIGLGLLFLAAVTLAALWLARAQLVGQFAQRYFRQHGIEAQVAVGALTLSGASGRFALGPAAAPELAAEKIELFFDPLRWTPYLVEVRLVNPLIRARMDAQGRITLPTLQAWLDSLTRNREKSPYVSDDLAVSLTGLRALLATPGGNVEIGGDARLERNLPVFAALTMKPARLSWRGQTLALQGASADVRSDGGGWRLQARVTGGFANAAMRADGASLALTAQGLRLDGGTITTGAARIEGAARSLSAQGVVGGNLLLSASASRLQFANGVVTVSGAEARLQATSDRPLKVTRFDAAMTGGDARVSAAGVDGATDVSLRATSSVPADVARAIRAMPALAMEPALARAVSRNLGAVTLEAKAHLERRGGRLRAGLIQPLLLRGSGGGVLRVDSLALDGTPQAGTGRLRAQLSGGGLPRLALASERFRWDARGFQASAALAGRLDFAALRGLTLALRGRASYGGGTLRFDQQACAPAALAALGPLARDIRGTLCPGRDPLFIFGRGGWRMDAELRDTAAVLPLADAALEGGAARLSFNGTGGLSGAVTVTAARLGDRAPATRFNPVTGTGEIALADGVWRGRFNAADTQKRALGHVDIRHAMASGEGGAHVEAALVFAQNGLQPETLSPLLAALRKADGRAEFSGDLAWNSGGLARHAGTLTVREFGFLTPLGRAHTVDTSLALTSLLPPVTAADQALKIARIDWTLPLSALDMRFSFSAATGKVTLDRLDTDIAQGHVSLAPFAVTLAAPEIASRATVGRLSLEPLIAASNLSGKASLTGRISGVIPFTAGPDGIRIKDGRLAADGPGRLSLNRSLWGENAATANLAQDYAYQALENLAFDSLTAELNSVAGGRLQVLFHIKGHSDPPKAQSGEIEVKLSDILDLSVLQRPAPLPSGTAIDLTLDTSLNFDELLKSYAEAWSKTLGGKDP